MRKAAGKTVISSQVPVAEPSGFDSQELDRVALDALFSVAYDELRRLAASVSSGDPSATLNPTALVNEAWIKLSESPSFATTSRMHFKRIAARAVRGKLVLVP